MTPEPAHRYTPGERASASASASARGGPRGEGKGGPGRASASAWTRLPPAPVTRLLTNGLPSNVGLPIGGTRSHRGLWTGALLFGAVTLLAVASVRLGVLDATARLTIIPWDFTLVVLAFLLTAFAGVLSVPHYPLKTRVAGLGTGRRDPKRVAAFAATVTGVAGGFALAGAAFAGTVNLWTRVGPFHVGPVAPLVLASLAILVALAPLGVLEHRRVARVKAMEERFPEFLRDVTEAHRQSMTMALALRAVARGDYGALTEEVRLMARQVSWGLPFATALQRFAERVDTPLINRTVSLVVKATEGGGDVTDVLDAAARDAREIKDLEEERRIAMSSYVIVVYVAFLVFLGVMGLLKLVFVPAMLDATTHAVDVPLRGIGVTTVTRVDFDFIYYSAGFVQAIGSGVMAGVLSEGSFAAGLKHASILLLISTVVLGLLP